MICLDNRIILRLGDGLDAGEELEGAVPGFWLE